MAVSVVSIVFKVVKQNKKSFHICYSMPSLRRSFPSWPNRPAKFPTNASAELDRSGIHLFHEFSITRFNKTQTSIMFFSFFIFIVSFLFARVYSFSVFVCFVVVVVFTLAIFNYTTKLYCELYNHLVLTQSSRREMSILCLSFCFFLYRLFNYIHHITKQRKKMTKPKCSILAFY